MLNYFCGLRLNTAGVVIGWLGAAWSLFVILLCGLALGYEEELAVWIKEATQGDQTQESFKQLIVVLCSVYITISAVNLLASALLIVGTFRERHLLLVPWLITVGISLFLNSVYLIFALITAISNSMPFDTIALSFISSGLSLVLQFYIWYAIYSLYKRIQATRDMQQGLITATSSYPSYTKM